MPELLDLPNELLCGILSFLTDSKNRPNLLSLCLVSRKLCTITQPILFSSYYDVGERPEGSNQSYTFYGSAPKWPLISFTRTVILRPDLASQVKHLDIETFDGGPWTNDEDFEAPSMDDLDIFIEAIDRLKMKNTSAWIDAILGSQVSAYIALLISQTPNIECLSIILTYERVDILLRLARRSRRLSSRLRPRCLTSLKTLNIAHHDVAGGFNLREIAPLLSLPSLETFSAENCLGNNDNEFGSSGCIKFAERTLNLSTIILNYSSVDAECLYTLIAACRSLKHFEYEAAKFHEITVDQFTPAELYSALQCQKSSLETLRADFSDFTDWSEEDEEEDDWLVSASLHGFANLKYLDVEEAYLVEPMELPRSLEVLVISQCRRSLIGKLTELAALRRTLFAVLREVRVVPPYADVNCMFGLPGDCRDKELIKEAFKKLKDMLGEVGIEFVFDPRRDRALSLDWTVTELAMRPP